MHTSSRRASFRSLFALLFAVVLLLGLSASLASAAPRGKAKGYDKRPAAEQPTKTSTSSSSKAVKPTTATPEAAEGETQHPSGKDRTTEPGGSGSQGASTSDPDGDSNGGLDKPGGDGGVYTGDQDGNNGCGNDQDFEDDNNGWCGNKPKPEKPAKDVKTPETDGGTAPATGTSEDTVTLPEQLPLPTVAKKYVSETIDDTVGSSVSGAAAAGDEVLGVSGVAASAIGASEVDAVLGSATGETEVLAAGAAGGSAVGFAALASTGTNVWVMLAAAAIALILGAVLIRRARTSR